MNCTPSYEMRQGTEVEEPLMAAALEQGWAVVVPDYEGLNSDFTGGPQDINLSTLLSPLGQQAEATVTSECVEDIVAQYAFQNIQTYTAGNINPLSVPGVQSAITADNVGQRTPVGPIFIYQAANDEIIPLAGVQTLNNAYCSEGVPVDFVKDELSDHISLAVSGAGAALNYLIARFAGTPAPNTCATGGVTVATTLLQPASNLLTLLAALAGLTGFF
jgi:hypothetical protein